MPEACGGPDPERLMAHLRVFARRVKLSGTAEEMESFRYLEAELDGLGFRTRLITHDAYISLPGPAQLEVGGTGFACITHSMARATPEGGVSGPLACVQDGTAADFAGADPADRILLVDGAASEEVAALASAAGALAVIHVSPTEQLYEMCVSPVWGSPGRSTLGALPRVAVCTVSQTDGARLKRLCAAGASATLWAQVRTGWRRTPLLQADMAPPDRPDAPFVLLSGHHDTWHFGVMDNGGANATMLECARLLAAEAGGWRRALRLCVWSGHSHGRYSGSSWYVDRHWDELDARCAGHVNVDSTGGRGADLLTESGVGEELRPLAAAAVAQVAGQRHRGKRLGRGADQSFLGLGIPSMFGSVSHQPDQIPSLPRLGWWWHTPEDTLDHIDPAILTRDTAVVLACLRRFLTAPLLPYGFTVLAAALEAELHPLLPALAAPLEMEAVTAALAEVAALAGAVEAARPRTAGDADPHLMRAARTLVPLAHVAGDRFHPDPALPQPAWPVLQPLRALAACPPGDPDRPFLEVDARRARNRLADGLRQGCHALRQAVAAARA